MKKLILILAVILGIFTGCLTAPTETKDDEIGYYDSQLLALSPLLQQREFFAAKTEEFCTNFDLPVLPDSNEFQTVIRQNLDETSAAKLTTEITTIIENKRIQKISGICQGEKNLYLSFTVLGEMGYAIGYYNVEKGLRFFENPVGDIGVFTGTFTPEIFDGKGVSFFMQGDPPLWVWKILTLDASNGEVKTIEDCQVIFEEEGKYTLTCDPRYSP